MSPTEKLRWALQHPKHALQVLGNRVNQLASRTRPPADTPHEAPDLDAVFALSRANPSAIGEHLPTLFIEAYAMRPKLIVELGVRGGDSTEVLARAARHSGARLVSVDIDPCARQIDYEGWTFVQQDDVAFAREFESWCAARSIAPRIDFLFIDTSHLYEHTVQEIDHWFPFLADRSKVLFHDTNIGDVYRKRDGTLTISWNNERGVIRALERHFGAEFDETASFVDLRQDWIIRHHPYSGGMTVLERVPGSSAS